MVVNTRSVKGLGFDLSYLYANKLPVAISWMRLEDMRISDQR